MTPERLVLVDVGAHIGQTISEAIDPRYGFTDVYALEPMPAQFEVLHECFYKVATPIIHFCAYGLSDVTGTVDVFGSNALLEASIYGGKSDVDATIVTPCDMVDAGEWFASHVGVTDRVFLKLNVEGAECRIIDSLLDSGELWTVEAMLVDFDCRKVPGLEGEEGRIRLRLSVAGFEDWMSADDLVGVKHGERIASWLDRVLA